MIERPCALGHRCQQSLSLDRAGVDRDFLKKATIDVEGQRRKTYYTSESVGIATGILIAALHRSGLATLRHTPNPMKFLSRILGRPAYERPLFLLLVGDPTGKASVPDIDRLPLSEIATII